MATEPPSPSGAHRRSWQPPERSIRGSLPLDETTAVGDEDALALSGPGAPGLASEHPVRARLLERSKNAVSRPLVHLGGAPHISHHLEDGSSAELVSATPEPSPQVPAPVSFVEAPAVSPESRVERPPATLTPAPPGVTEELERIAGVDSRRHTRQREDGPPRSPYVLLALYMFVGLSALLVGSLFVDRLYEKETSLPDGLPEVPKAPSPDKPPPITRQKVEGPPRLAAWVTPGRRVLTGRVGKEPFLKALEAAGLPKSETYRAFAALKTVRNLDHCAATDRFEALVEGPTKRLISLEYLVSPEEVYQAKADANGSLKGARLDLKVERNQIRRALAMNGSFDESARLAGFDPGLGNVLDRALSGHITLRELKRGDRLRVVVQEVTVLGEFARYAGVESLEIDRQNGKPERFYYFHQGADTGYFDAQGRAPWEGGFRKPIPGAPVTSKFNMKRMHPVLKKVMPHTGTDFGAPAGTPILSTKAGKVIFMGWGGPSGNLVKVAHDGGYESGYAHLSRFAESLKVGDSIDRLTLVGYCGSTGRSTGPHLHFTIRKNGEFIDPESVNLDGKRVLSPSARDAFAQVRAKYDPVLDGTPWPEALPSGPPDAGPTEFVAAGEADMEGEGPSASASATTPAPTGGSHPAALGAPPLSPSQATNTIAKAAPQPSPLPSPNAALDPARPPTPRPNPAEPLAPSAGPKNSIFLSDSDLLKMQSGSDAGEVP